MAVSRWMPVFVGALVASTAVGLRTAANTEPGPSQPNVLIIGGSAAFGWRDITGQGFVVRGLRGWSRVPLRFENRAVPGATVKNPIITKNYYAWLTTYHPTIVALQWGLLNDLRVGTPWPKVIETIQQEILQALSQNAVVFIITPPATRPTYTIDQQSEPRLAEAEIAMAKALNSPNVYVLNVLQRMKDWLTAHHQTYVPYMAGLWDPNTKGHILAGHLLTEALHQQLPGGSVSFHPNGAFTPGLLYQSASTGSPRLMGLASDAPSGGQGRRG